MEVARRGEEQARRIVKGRQQIREAEKKTSANRERLKRKRRSAADRI